MSDTSEHIDPEAGLEPRYHVKKIDDPDGKHDDCQYFVLDPQHDVLARGALLSYANACLDEGREQLARDLVALVTSCEEADLVQRLGQELAYAVVAAGQQKAAEQRAKVEEYLANKVGHHEFESYEGASGFTCTAMVLRERAGVEGGYGSDCGLPADHPIHRVDDGFGDEGREHT